MTLAILTPCWYNRQPSVTYLPVGLTTTCSRRCSLDPALFDNFNTTTGDYVTANFRAFKFPETNYVLFRGTVDVCLDKCQGVSELVWETD